MNNHGVTIIELLITIAIIGILAVISMTSFQKFLLQAKTSEAPLNLKAMAAGAIAWYNEEHTDSNGDPEVRHYPYLPQFGSPPYPIFETPTASLCSSSTGALYPKNSAHWTSKPWSQLNFSISSAHYYRYGYLAGYGPDYYKGTVNGIPYFLAQATGDLDCDGTFSTFTLIGHAWKGDIAKGTAMMALEETKLSEITVQNEFE